MLECLRFQHCCEAIRPMFIDPVNCLRPLTVVINSRSVHGLQCEGGTRLVAMCMERYGNSTVIL